MIEKKTQTKNKKDLNDDVLKNLAKEEIVRFMTMQNGAVIEGIKSDMKIFQDQLNHMDSKMDKGFNRLENRIENLEDKVGDLEEKVDELKDEVGFIKNYLQENLEPRVNYLETSKR